MHVEFTITGTLHVPDGTVPVPGTRNLFRLPGGECISVHPVIEMASTGESDDHRDITIAEAAALGIDLGLYDRDSELMSDR